VPTASMVLSGLPDGRAAASSPAGAQRARLLAAVVTLACEEGVANLTVASITGRAGISRRTFYELFDDVEDCLLAAFENALAQAHDQLVGVWQTKSGDWRGRIRAALAKLLALFDRRPQLAHLLIVEWPTAGTAALERRFRLQAQLAAAVDEGRQQANGNTSADPPSLTAEGLVGAVAAILHTRLLDPDPQAQMLELLNPLMSMIVLPYLGAAAARRERGRPAPIASMTYEATQPETSLERLDVRITYRTVTVLCALAAHPGASNRLVAREAGVTDQGQMSKLLHRLQRAGIVENRLTGSMRGTPNVWALTAKGQRIERSLRP
jgi:AcrR family transcriptional regulator/DNA-binding MarR family transcriptional regulator